MPRIGLLTRVSRSGVLLGAERLRRTVAMLLALEHVNSKLSRVCFAVSACCAVNTVSKLYAQPLPTSQFVPEVANLTKDFQMSYIMRDTRSTSSDSQVRSRLFLSLSLHADLSSPSFFAAYHTESSTRNAGPRGIGLHWCFPFCGFRDGCPSGPAFERAPSIVCFNLGLALRCISIPKLCPCDT